MPSSISLNDDTPPLPNYYELLNVPPTASDTELKKAWRRKAIELHPDKHPDDADKYATLFDTAKKAFEILSNPAERQSYDEKLAKVEAKKQATIEREKRYANEDKRIQQMRIQLEQREQEAAIASTAKRVRLNENVQRAQTNSYIQQLKQQRMEEQQRQFKATNIPDKPVMHQSYNPNPHHHSASHDNESKHASPASSKPTSISIKWPKNDAVVASLYSESYLRAAFGVYGHILHIVLNSQRCRAIIVYEQQQSAIAALGMVKIDSKLKVKLLDDRDGGNNQEGDDEKGGDTNATANTNNAHVAQPAAATDEPHNAASTDALSHEQYEAQTLARMHAAAAARKAKLKSKQTAEAANTLYVHTDASNPDVPIDAAKHTTDR